MIEEGEKAPSLEVQMTTGETVNVGNPGKPLVLYFYPKDDTPGCTTEAKDFSALASEFDKAGAMVVGVSRDPMTKHEKFIAKHELSVPLVADEDGALSDAFGTWTMKKLYGREYMGMQRATFLIDGDGKIRRVWPKVRVKGHADEVLRAIHDVDS